MTKKADKPVSSVRDPEFVKWRKIALQNGLSEHTFRTRIKVRGYSYQKAATEPVKKISDEDRRAIIKYFDECENVHETAEKFDVAVSTVYMLRRKRDRYGMEKKMPRAFDGWGFRTESQETAHA